MLTLMNAWNSKFTGSSDSRKPTLVFVVIASCFNMAHMRPPVCSRGVSTSPPSVRYLLWNVKNTLPGSAAILSLVLWIAAGVMGCWRMSKPGLSPCLCSSDKATCVNHLSACSFVRKCVAN